MRLDASDGVGLAGLFFLGIGLWLWWPPAALMVTGGLLVGHYLLGEVLALRVRR